MTITKCEQTALTVATGWTKCESAKDVEGEGLYVVSLGGEGTCYAIPENIDPIVKNDHFINVDRSKLDFISTIRDKVGIYEQLRSMPKKKVPSALDGMEFDKRIRDVTGNNGLFPMFNNKKDEERR